MAVENGNRSEKQLRCNICCLYKHYRLIVARVAMMNTLLAIKLYGRIIVILVRMLNMGPTRHSAKLVEMMT